MLREGSGSSPRQTKMKKKLIIIALVVVIILISVFLYLFLTRNPMLRELPVFSRTQEPVYLYSLEGPFDDPMDMPLGVAVDESGNVFVTDSTKNRVLVFDANGSFVFSFGTLGEAAGKLGYPYGVDVYQDRVYVAEVENARVQVFSAAGDFLEVLITGSSLPEIGGFQPAGLAVSRKTGDVYITDTIGHRVIVLDSKGKLKFTVGRPGNGAGELAYPNGVALDEKGNIYVADSNNARVQVFSPDGQKVIRSFDGETRGEGKFSLPRSVSVGPRGNLWVTDTLNHRFSMYDGEKLVFSIGELGMDEGQLYFPNGVFVDKNGRIYVTERRVNRISVFGNRR